MLTELGYDMEENIVTYDLCNNQASSQEFYRKLDRLTVVLTDQLMDSLSDELYNYQLFIRNTRQEIQRDPIEYGIELILFGILHRWFERMRNESYHHRTYKFQDIRLVDLSETLMYLEQSGEFQEEVLRFHQWMSYFATLKADSLTNLWNKVSNIIELLDHLGNRELNSYLPHVDEFVDHYKTSGSERKDLALLLRDKSCYYINMFGATMLNQLYRKDFIVAKRYYVFLPGCMSSCGVQCKAKHVPDGYECSHCGKNCMVSRITEKCRDMGVKVRILFHESEMNQRTVQREDMIGVVGIACILNLLSGGFKARRLGYIPQCVFLDYCGCRQHWSEKGIVTAINEEQLYRILNVN